MRTTLVSVTALATLATAALAQHGGDIFLDIDHGSIRTNLLEESGKVVQGVRVFAAEFGEVFPDFTDEPGFDSAPGTFPVPSSNWFVIRRSLRKWTGADFSMATKERIEIAFASLGPVSTPPDDSPVTGFELPVGANGQWHRHLEFTLTPPAAQGIYLLELDLRSTSKAVTPSLPFWLVFNQNVEEAEHEAAVEWARSNLGNACRADYNEDSRVNSQDFFDFLTAFFAGSADFNADGSTNSQDFFDFLGEFFVGC